VAVRSALREAALVAVGGAVAGGAVWFLFMLGSYRARADLCVVTGLVVAAGWRLLRSALPAPDTPPEPPPPREGGGDGFDELESLEHSLSWGSVDADRFGQRVRPLLVRIAVERLRSRRAVDPRSQPDQARRIVGESLWELMTGPPPSRCPSRAELTRLVDDLERI
jgi:hypothetical protein